MHIEWHGQNTTVVTTAAVVLDPVQAMNLFLLRISHPFDERCVYCSSHPISLEQPREIRRFPTGNQSMDVEFLVCYTDGQVGKVRQDEKFMCSLVYGHQEEKKQSS
ncbi:hypothetical protein BDV26DRAFT_241547 [Aspergillus bertholletiae]|uniref:Uncharacterized protein n=1 Tax=Aspergillus bertholletiae TaxID=1226010 RepID=A0A5N7B2L1_9EURO|nr:hypothetical protein BDV26DRAFT_241547 [Aspergillus bertholletiae]